MRYTIVGRWHGAGVQVVWEDGVLEGDPELVDQIHATAEGNHDISRLGAALELIGTCLDAVDRLHVDDGEAPSPLTEGTTLMSAYRRRRWYGSAGQTAPPPRIA